MNEHDESMRELLLESTGDLNALDRDFVALVQVEVAPLDRVMNLVGEPVLAQSNELMNDLSFLCHSSRITLPVIKARRAGCLDALSP